MTSILGCAHGRAPSVPCPHCIGIGAASTFIASPGEMGQTAQENELDHVRAELRAALAERDQARDAVQAACDVAVTAACAAIERERDEALARVRVLEAALRSVDAQCDHADDICHRTREWATHDTPCTCCMRDVEAALEAKAP